MRSHHHQGVAPLAGALRAPAHAPDGLVEAAETTGGGWCVAVLWHPEEDLEAGGQRLYESLVAAAARVRAAASGGPPRVSVTLRAQRRADFERWSRRRSSRRT